MADEELRSGVVPFSKRPRLDSSSNDTNCECSNKNRVTLKGSDADTGNNHLIMNTFQVISQFSQL